MTSTLNQFDRETVASDVIAGKGKRFIVEASDDTATGGQWGVRIWELQFEAGRGDVRCIKMHTKVADRDSAVKLADQVVEKIKAQMA